MATHPLGGSLQHRPRPAPLHKLEQSWEGPHTHLKAVGRLLTQVACRRLDACMNEGGSSAMQLWACCKTARALRQTRAASMHATHTRIVEEHVQGPAAGLELITHGLDGTVGGVCDGSDCGSERERAGKSLYAA
jgi:hypothetical protein